MYIYIPKYVNGYLNKFQQPNPQESQDESHQCNRPIYGAATQHPEPEDESAPVPPEVITIVRKIVGNFIFYALVVDSNILVALGDLTRTQSKSTNKSYNDVVRLLNHASRHPADITRYKQSDMIL